MIKSKSGYSLMSVMVVTAIGGIIAVVIMALIDNVTSVMIKGNAADSFEGTMRAVGSVIANKKFCDNALRGNGPGDRIVYNVQDNPVGPPTGGNEVDILNIFVQENHNTPGATAIVSMVAGNSLSNIYGGARINYIRFRERQRGIGRGEVTINGEAHDTYAGEVEIDLISPGTSTGAALRRRVPYNAVVNRDTRQIVGCYNADNNSSMQYLCTSIGGNWEEATGSCNSMVNSSTVDCRNECTNNTANCPGGNCVLTGQAPYCRALYSVVGFSSINPPQMTPICACTEVCWARPDLGPPASSPGAGAAATRGGRGN